MFTNKEMYGIIYLQYNIYTYTLRKGINVMKKISKIFKIFLTLGIIVSAALAVAAIFSRMQKKLQEVDGEECDGDEDEGECGGSCAECGLCDTEAEEDDSLDFEMDESDGEETED